MKAEQLLKELIDKQVILTINNGKLNCKAPIGILTNELRQQISNHKEALLILLSQEDKANQSRQYRLSLEQERLWYLNTAREANPVFNIALAVKTVSQIDLDCLKMCMEMV